MPILPMRSGAKFDNAVTDFIVRLQSDPALRYKIEAIKLEIVHDQSHSRLCHEYRQRSEELAER